MIIKEDPDASCVVTVPMQYVSAKDLEMVEAATGEDGDDESDAWDWIYLLTIDRDMSGVQTKSGLPSSRFREWDTHNLTAGVRNGDLRKTHLKDCEIQHQYVWFAWN